VTKAVTYNDQYRDIEHFSKFVPNGATHIASTVDTNSSKGAPLTTVAFTNPDHSTSLVALNTGTTTQTFTVVYGTHSFDATLPAGGTVTYQWGRIH
jgi:glucosylceramidase